MGIDALQTHSPESDGGTSIHHLAPASMQIVCGTDFSTSARKAGEAAAALASQLREPLILIHAFDEPSRILLPKELRDSLRSFEQQQLREEALRLQADGRAVREVFRDGSPAEVLAEFGEQPSTRLIVVSSGRHTAAATWILGSVAERVTHASTVPTLVVRDPAPFVAWAQGKRKLRVFVAADFSVGSDAALAWVRWLRQLGRCEITVAYIEPSFVGDGAYAAQPSPGAAPLLAKIEHTEEACFRRRVRKLLATNRVRMCFERDWGRSDAHLIQMARTQLADLMVVGINERHGLSRIAHHSVSRAIVHYASTNVACIPTAFSAHTTAIREH
jgi:nucleotide-binding universal stress UspA family protein